MNVFLWPTMRGDVAQYCAMCETCQKRAWARTSDNWQGPNHHPIPRVVILFAHVVMDCIHPQLITVSNIIIVWYSLMYRRDGQPLALFIIG